MSEGEAEGHAVFDAVGDVLEHTAQLSLSSHFSYEIIDKIYTYMSQNAIDYMYDEHINIIQRSIEETVLGPDNETDE